MKINRYFMNIDTMAHPVYELTLEPNETPDFWFEWVEVTEEEYLDYLAEQKEI